jgi:starvation-inducible DNA-binding protein
VGDIQLHETRNDLREPTRRAMVALLNRQLADTIDLRLQTKQAHWNVKGPQFIALHELFDRAYEEVGGFEDVIAERAVQLGGVALGTVQAVGRATRVAPYPLDVASGRGHVAALAGAVGSVASSTRAAIDEAAEASDADTADVFTEISRGLDKLLWLIEAHEHSKD